MVIGLLDEGKIFTSGILFPFQAGNSNTGGFIGFTESVINLCGTVGLTLLIQFVPHPPKVHCPCGLTFAPVTFLTNAANSGFCNICSLYAFWALRSVRDWGLVSFLAKSSFCKLELSIELGFSCFIFSLFPHQPLIPFLLTFAVIPKSFHKVAVSKLGFSNSIPAFLSLL